MGLNFKTIWLCSCKLTRAYSCALPVQNTYKCKLLIAGGGAGGCSLAWRFSRKLKQDDIIVIEPSPVHYYQPDFTLVACGVKPFKATHRPTASLLPPAVVWLQDRVQEFDPCNNSVYIEKGDKIVYDFMVVAVGLQNDYDQIPGLAAALDSAAAPVSTVYSAAHCGKTWRLLQQFRGGLALFCRPRQTGKCSGAAHCVTCLADHYWRKHKIRNQTSIMYVTGDDTSYGVPKYARALNRITADRGIAVNYHMELAGVTPRGALFVDEDQGCIILPFNFLHVTPPMAPPGCLARCRELVTSEGYLDVDRRLLRHRTVCNVFGIGDCLATPNSKTAAAVAQQSPVVFENLWSVMAGKEPTAEYNGYGACPILTSYGSAILAEFIYDRHVFETFPFDQSKESRFLYNLKKYIMPYVYWNKLLKGQWDGPDKLRRIINPLGR